MPIKQRGKTKYTWVNTLSATLLRLVQENGGSLDSTQVSKLKQKDRALVVSISLHPLTAKQAQVQSVWQVLRKSTSKALPRMATDSSTESSSDDVDPARKSPANELVSMVANELLDLVAVEAQRAQSLF